MQGKCTVSKVCRENVQYLKYAGKIFFFESIIKDDRIIIPYLFLPYLVNVYHIIKLLILYHFVSKNTAFVCIGKITHPVLLRFQKTL